MNSKIISIIVVGIVFSTISSFAEQSADVCKQPNETKIIADAKAQKNPFEAESKLGDGMHFSGQSSLSMKDGSIGDFRQKDFYFMIDAGANIPYLFSRFWAKPYQDKDDKPKGGMLKVQVDNLANGVTCPLGSVDDNYEDIGKFHYQHFLNQIQKDDVFCVRMADGVHYGLLQVKTVCSDSVLIRWVSHQDDNRTFSTDSSDGQNSRPIETPPLRSGG